VSVTDPAGHTIETRYYCVAGEPCNPAAGQLPGLVESVRDVNNNDSTYYSYDTFGRLSKTWLPGDTPFDPNPASTLLEYAPNGTLPAWVHTRQRDDDRSGAATYLESWKIYDGLGRLIQTQAESEDTGQLVLTSRQYDAMGQLGKESVPYETTLSGGTYAAPVWEPEQLAYITYTYDALGRPVQTTAPDGSVSEHYYGIWNDLNLGKMVAYDDLMDGNRHRTQKRYDSLGRLVKVQEISGSCGDAHERTYSCGAQEPTWDVYTNTVYVYDEADNLREVHDGAQNVSEMWYDMLGRKTEMDDPDMGEWHYEYDAAGNLLHQTDARGQTISFEYDTLNRLTRQDNPNDADVYYKYDDFEGLGLSKNSWGRLRVVFVGNSDDVYASENRYWYTYDDRGQVIGEVQRLDGAAYATWYEYDSLGRLETMTYPDGEVVRTQYNAQGLPHTLFNAGYEYVDNNATVPGATYTALGQPEFLRFGGGLDAQIRYTLS